jgi:chorismate dehydratase
MTTGKDRLDIGRIDYLNVEPVFRVLETRLKSEQGFAYYRGHPSRLNSLLRSNQLDLSPSSSFEYLVNAEAYRLLPKASVSCNGPVQSVLLVSPVSLEHLAPFLDSCPSVLLSTASASSVALLKILWRLAWRLPEPCWESVLPGQGLAQGRPFLEIGDLALRLYLDPPPGWHLYDLGQAWKDFTGLPFVFAVWIVRRGLDQSKLDKLQDIGRAISEVSRSWPEDLDPLLQDTPRPSWLSSNQLQDYWQNLVPGFSPLEQAGLLQFGRLATATGLLSGCPGLSWAL